MEPLDPYEIQELLAAMGDGTNPTPIGSLWASPDAEQMFLVLHHANMPLAMGVAEQVLVLQAIPSGEAWIQPMSTIINEGWKHMGFIWDRGVNV